MDLDFSIQIVQLKEEFMFKGVFADRKNNKQIKHSICQAVMIPKATLQNELLYTLRLKLNENIESPLMYSRKKCCSNAIQSFVFFKSVPRRANRLPRFSLPSSCCLSPLLLLSLENNMTPFSGPVSS